MMEELTEDEVSTVYGLVNVRGEEFDDVEVLMNSWRL